MSNPPAQRLRKFRFNFPQRVAALLLLLFLAQCFLVIANTQPTTREVRDAVCGSRMWAAFSAPTPTPQACRNLRGGVLSYRAAGLPLAIDNWVAGRPADALTTSVYRHLEALTLWMRLPFLLAGLALGGCLWWVTRRLFGNPGGYIALGFYCFAPPVIARSVFPNNAILAAFGLFSAIYTAIGVAHALQGPRRKWPKRVVLLTLALGFTAAASTLAFLLALVLGTILLVWLAEERRKYVPALTLIWTGGALLIFFAAGGFQPSVFSAFLHIAPAAGASDPLPAFLLGSSTWPIRLGLAVALVLYATCRRSRYFGNTTPLWIAGLLILLAATSVQARAWLWAIPFLLAFLGGIYADALETRLRKLSFLFLATLLVVQAFLSLASLHSIPARPF